MPRSRSVGSGMIKTKSLRRVLSGGKARVEPEVTEFASMRSSQESIQQLVMMQIREGEDYKVVRAYYRRLLVHPSTPWLYYWMLFVGALLLYNTLCIPLRMIFIMPDGTARYQPGGEPHSNALGSTQHYPGWEILDLLVDALFAIDIALHFRLGYYVRADGTDKTAPAQCIMDPHAIACRYLRFWFWIDSVAIFPWQHLASDGDNSDGAEAVVLLRNLRLIRLLRLFRLVQMRSFFKNWDSTGHAFKHPVLQRLLKQLLVMLMISHLISCALYSIAWAQGFSDATWVANNDVGTEWWEHYFAALYWTIMTLTTVGYGDISMKTVPERIFAGLIMFAGAIFFAFMMSNVAELVREIDASSTVVRKRMDSVNGYMRYRGFPEYLQARIRKYYSFYWSRQSIFDETAIMKNLPSHLRREVSLCLHREMISKVPFFHDADTSFISSLVQALAPLCAAPQDFVITVGETVFEMFFVDFGGVEVWNADMTSLYRVTRSGGFFGEVGLLTREPSTCNCRAITYVELWSLSRENLEQLTQHAPKMGAKMQQVARERLAAELSHELTTRASQRTFGAGAPAGAVGFGKMSAWTAARGDVHAGCALTKGLDEAGKPLGSSSNGDDKGGNALATVVAAAASRQNALGSQRDDDSKDSNDESADEARAPSPYSSFTHGGGSSDKALAPAPELGSPVRVGRPAPVKTGDEEAAAATAGSPAVAGSPGHTPFRKATSSAASEKKRRMSTRGSTRGLPRLSRSSSAVSAASAVDSGAESGNESGAEGPSSDKKRLSRSMRRRLSMSGGAGRQSMRQSGYLSAEDQEDLASLGPDGKPADDDCASKAVLQHKSGVDQASKDRASKEEQDNPREDNVLETMKRALVKIQAARAVEDLGGLRSPFSDVAAAAAAHAVAFPSGALGNAAPPLSPSPLGITAGSGVGVTIGGDGGGGSGGGGGGDGASEARLQQVEQRMDLMMASFQRSIADLAAAVREGPAAGASPPQRPSYESPSPRPAAVLTPEEEAASTTVQVFNLEAASNSPDRPHTSVGKHVTSPQPGPGRPAALASPRSGRACLQPACLRCLWR